jgi:hypothetical protein
MTSTSHDSHAVTRSSGEDPKASGSVRSRNHNGRHSASPASTTAHGTSGDSALTVSVPRLELALRSSTAPPSPCSKFPKKAPMSDTPAAGTR